MGNDENVPASSSLASGGSVRVVLSTAPPGEAQRLAHALVEAGVAACVNLVPGVRSVYRWKGQVADDPETLLIAKVGAEHVEALAERLAALHPYEVPELLTLTPDQGLAQYVRWLGEQAPNA